MDKIILASGSPRRRQLLEWAHIPFEVFAADIDETPPAGLAPEVLPAFLAEKKAQAVAARFPGKTILAADTIVLSANEILGKPRDAAHAQEILQKLSGKMHRVLTGVCLLREQKSEVFTRTTEVYFRPLTEEQIDFYIREYQPFDKAGAYAIQEYIGLVGIEKINGDYYNVMGLPVGEVVAWLRLFHETSL